MGWIVKFDKLSDVSPHVQYSRGLEAPFTTQGEAEGFACWLKWRQQLGLASYENIEVYAR